MHDFEHRGVNNDFLVRSFDALALLYNDRSPHENHHLAAAWGLLVEHNFLGGISHKNKVGRGQHCALQEVGLCTWLGLRVQE